MKNSVPIILISLFVLSGCANKRDLRSYYQYLADPSNGLVKKKEVAGLKYEVRFLPAELLAHNTMKSNPATDPRQKDSLVKIYTNSMSFLLTIGPGKGESFDITRLGVNDYGEFSERLDKLAFHAAEWIGLERGDSLIKPEIVQMESINTPGHNRSFVVVFDALKTITNDEQGNDVSFVYTDELFQTGINQFHFKAEDFNDIPNLKF